MINYIFIGIIFCYVLIKFISYKKIQKANISLEETDNNFIAALNKQGDKK